MGGVLGNRVGDSTGMIVVFLTAILTRLQGVRWYFLPHGSILYLSSPDVLSSGRCDYALAILVTVCYCLSKITKICLTGLWALILLKTPVLQFLWDGLLLWLPVLSCSCPAGHVHTWGNCEVWPLFTPGSQPERTRSLWQSISSLPDRNVFQQHYLWQQLRNCYQT